MTKPSKTDQLIAGALEIEAQEAKEEGALGFMARALVQATMPHSKTEENEFTRVNGDYRLTMIAPKDIGLPYGTMPRLLLSWITSEAVKTQERELILGNSLSEFMRELEIIPTGGRWGSITRLKDQTRRLFNSNIHCNYLGVDLESGMTRESSVNFNIAERSDLWWHIKNKDQPTLFESTLTLSQPFFDEIIRRPVPVDLRALKILRKSPLALDIYMWMTYRFSYLKRPTNVTWEQLRAQLGSNYSETPKGLRDFKRNFLGQLRKVLAIYPEANTTETKNGILLRPSKTHILK